MYRRLMTRSVLALLIVSAAGFILLMGTLQYGLVSGEEFAPDTFQRRAYWYYELPLIRLKITPVKRSVQRNQLETMLLTKKYVTSTTPPQRWDLVAATRGMKPWRQGDAQILCHYLDAYDFAKTSTSFWETWTADHPGMAKVMWPEIASLARRDLYFLIPSLFELALEHKKPRALQRSMSLRLAEDFDVLAAAEVELGNLETAVRFYTDALQHQPGRPTSLEGRAACYEELGKPLEAKRDRQVSTQTVSMPTEKETK